MAFDARDSDALALYEEAGFRVEGVARKARIVAGANRDLVTLALYNDVWRDDERLAARLGVAVAQQREASGDRRRRTETKKGR